MATVKNLTSPYSGRPAFFISYTVERVQVSGTRSKWRCRLSARNPNGSTQTYALDQYRWTMAAGGFSWSGTHSLDFRSGATTILLADRTTDWIEQGSGTPTISMSASHGPAAIFGSASVSGSFAADRLASVPGAPGTPSVSAIDTDQATFSWSAAAANGSAILNYGIYVSPYSDYRSYTYNAWVGTGRTFRLPVDTLSPATNYWVRSRATNGVGTGGYSGSRAFHSAPAAPATPTVGTPGTSSIPLTWARGANGNALSGYDIQYADNNTFTDAKMMSVGVVTAATLANLAPNDDYWIRIRAKTSSFQSAWSPAVKARTVGTGAPTLSVKAGLNGTTATATLGRPAGVSSVTSYRVERRPLGSSSATTVNTSTSPLTVSGLTPGGVYQWRASAFIGDYQTPWTDWVTVVQPDPGTQPGDYFDGSTAAKTDASYSWQGTAHASRSQATSLKPTGWGAFDMDANGATGVISRASGGRSGSFAARVAFFSGTTTPGFHAGLSMAVGTEQGARHEGLIHVQLPSRTQLLAAMLIWQDSSGAELSRVVGEPTLVGASSSLWTPLYVVDVAPTGTASVLLRVIDVAGPGWSPWQGGDVLLIDDAITPFGAYYFDGDTPDTQRYDYIWEGAPQGSPSMRTTLMVDAPNPLMDPDCPPVPLPPRPPAIVDSCVEDDIIHWRRIYTSIGDGENAGLVPEWLEAVPTLKLSASTDVRLVRIRYYQNPFSRPLLDLNMDEFCGEQLITFVPSGAILTLDGISERVWAEVGGSASSLPADHLLATAETSAPQWPTLSCGTPHYLTIDVPIDTAPNALSAEYDLTVRHR